MAIIETTDKAGKKIHKYQEPEWKILYEKLAILLESFGSYVNAHSDLTLDVALIKRNVMHLGVIDDLFAYRFFIAVNNPVVQKFELLPYANYYQGCFELSEMWTKQWRKKKRSIPLDQYALYECNKSLLNVPAENQKKNYV